MVSLFESPRDIRKRQEPQIGVMEMVSLDADIRRAVNEEEKRLQQEAFQQALKDYRLARLELERAKRRYREQVDAIRTRVGLPKFLDS